MYVCGNHTMPVERTPMKHCRFLTRTLKAANIRSWHLLTYQGSRLQQGTSFVNAYIKTVQQGGAFLTSIGNGTKPRSLQWGNAKHFSLIKYVKLLFLIQYAICKHSALFINGSFSMQALSSLYQLFIQYASTQLSLSIVHSVCKQHSALFINGLLRMQPLRTCNNLAP